MFLSQHSDVNSNMRDIDDEDIAVVEEEEEEEEEEEREGKMGEASMSP